MRTINYKFLLRLICSTLLCVSLASNATTCIKEESVMVGVQANLANNLVPGNQSFATHVASLWTVGSNYASIPRMGVFGQDIADLSQSMAQFMRQKYLLGNNAIAETHLDAFINNYINTLESVLNYPGGFGGPGSTDTKMIALRTLDVMAGYFGFIDVNNFNNRFNSGNGWLFQSNDSNNNVFARNAYRAQMNAINDIVNNTVQPGEKAKAYAMGVFINANGTESFFPGFRINYSRANSDSTGISLIEATPGWENIIQYATRSNGATNKTKYRITDRVAFVDWLESNVYSTNGVSFLNPALKQRMLDKLEQSGPNREIDNRASGLYGAHAEVRLVNDILNAQNITATPASGNFLDTIGVHTVRVFESQLPSGCGFYCCSSCTEILGGWVTATAGLGTRIVRPESNTTV